MRDQLARERIDARIAGKRTIRELWQLEVVPARQVLPHFAHLVLDDMVVVAQPLLGTDAVLLGARARGKHQVNLVEAVGAAVELR